LKPKVAPEAVVAGFEVRARLALFFHYSYLFDLPDKVPDRRGVRCQRLLKQVTSRRFTINVVVTGSHHSPTSTRWHGDRLLIEAFQVRIARNNGHFASNIAIRKNQT
jgi:hypothetical protein